MEYNLPTSTQITSQFANAKIVTVLDLASAYWQTPVGEKLRELQNFYSYNGVYNFNRLLMGSKSSGQILSCVLSQVFENLNLSSDADIIIYCDDIIIINNNFCHCC